MITCIQQILGKHLLQADRYNEFIEQRTKISNILSDIGLEVTTEFEQDVVIEDTECFVLSEMNMAQLRAFSEQVNLLGNFSIMCQRH